MIATVTLAALLALPQGECKVEKKPNSNEVVVKQGDKALSLSLDAKDLKQHQEKGVLYASNGGAQWLLSKGRVFRAVYRANSELIDCNFRY